MYILQIKQYIHKSSNSNSTKVYHGTSHMRFLSLSNNVINIVFVK